MKRIMKKISGVLSLLTSLLVIISCRKGDNAMTVRQPVDTIGFAQYGWQVDSVLARVGRLQSVQLAEAEASLADSLPLRVAISPHDDYSYVGYLYPALLSNVKSDVVILFGVGHKASTFRLEDKIIFGSYNSWRSPGGIVNVSQLQDSLIKKLPDGMFAIHDSLQTVEHSLEALVPFLEHYNRDLKIIPIIVPTMSFERMEIIASSLSEAIVKTMEEAGLPWGRGWSIAISTDAVHYGNEDWGGKNYDRFGVDSAGYLLAVEYEKQIMNETLAGELNPEKIRGFSICTVQDSDYHNYKWTWCGRYAVPMGLLTAFDISLKIGETLTGTPAGYSTSIAHNPIPVADLGMGVTAPAKLTHWVGYAAVGYR